MPPTTPFQPGAPPSPPLSPLFAGLGGLLLLGQALWGLLNFRNPDSPGELEEGQRIDFGTVDRPIVITGTYSSQQITLVSPSDGTPSGLTSGPSSTPFETGGLGVAVTLNPGSGSTGWACSGGGSQTASTATLHRADGSSAVIALGTQFGVAPAGNGPFGLCGTASAQNTVGSISYDGDPYEPPAIPGEPVPQQVRPRLPSTAPPVAALPAAAPLIRPPVAGSAPAPVASQPVPRPAPAPGGAPSSQPRPAAAPAVRPNPSPAPAVAPPLPNPVPITPAGPVVIPSPPVVPTTPATGVVVGGELIGGPGQAPAPNLAAMAAELGRLERKAELTLEGGATAVGVSALAELLQDLIARLLAITPGTTYTIQPPCGTKPDGGPLDPVEVIAPGGDTPEAAILNRLDALAMLIDEHKRIRQPICKGKPTGEAVTVTFIEAE